MTDGEGPHPEAVNTAEGADTFSMSDSAIRDENASREADGRIDGRKALLEAGEREIIGLSNSSASDKKGIFLFVSFDLLNSTSFKSKEEDKWPNAIVFFYNALTNMMKEEIPGATIWKYLGDEIVFCYDVQDIKKVYDIPDILYYIQETVSEKIRTRTDHSDMLDIKCTVWLAGTIFVWAGDDELGESKKDSIYRNIHIPLTTDGSTARDFLGADIDIGFRIARHSNKRTVTLSAEYAYLLHHLSKPDMPAMRSKIDAKLKIVAFRELKGIWNGRAYPIVWYYPDWESSDDSFDYDEYINNDIIKNISGKKKIGYLEKVFKEAGQKKYIDAFIEACKGCAQEDEEYAAIVFPLENGLGKAI